MISVALLLLQVAPYHALPSIDRESIARCEAAADRLHSEVAYFKTWVTAHEVENGGRLNTEEAVQYRHFADQVTRPFMDEIKLLRVAHGSAEACEAISAEGRDVLVQEVTGPLFGPHYGYVREADGFWRRPAGAGPTPRKH